jgi:hypothetical protein
MQRRVVSLRGAQSARDPITAVREQRADVVARDLDSILAFLAIQARYQLALLLILGSLSL